MSTVTFDVSQIERFAAAMNTAPTQMQTEMTKTAVAVLVEGVGLAQENAPVDEGMLHNSIGLIGVPTSAGGSFGTSLEYAHMREFGGTITARNAPYLTFKGRDGKWVSVKSVTQTGTLYMTRAADTLEARLPELYGLAIDRVLGPLSLGGN